MNRPMEELPVIRVSSIESYDSSGSMTVKPLRIEVSVNELSNGFLYLDYPEDLYILRSAIDSYISRHGISPSENTILKEGGEV